MTSNSSDWGIVEPRKGKRYYTVARRVHDFREVYPAGDGWGISTEIIARDDTFVVMKATISDPSGRTIATGFAEELREGSRINATSCLENCETSAIGRALAAVGLLGGGEYCSADELALAITQQKNGANAEDIRFYGQIDQLRKRLAEKLGDENADEVYGFVLSEHGAVKRSQITGREARVSFYKALKAEVEK